MLMYGVVCCKPLLGCLRWMVGPVPMHAMPSGWTQDHTIQSGPEVYCPLPQATIPTPPNNYKSKKNACPIPIRPRKMP